MRYLWVEDFNNDASERTKNEEYWTKYFKINKSECTFKENLEETLIYLEEPKNHGNFDAVLIDIRFPVLKYNSKRTLDDIYEIYFSKRITKELFTEYAGEKDGHNSNASAGFLLFLALILNYGYTADNIVFISANVDNKQLNELYFLKEMLKKAEYLSSDKLSEDEKSTYKSYSFDRKQYRTSYKIIFEKRREIYGEYYESIAEDALKKEEFDKLEKKLSLKKSQEIWNIKNPEMLCERLCEFQKDIGKFKSFPEKRESEHDVPPEKGTKYRTVKEHFEKMGLIMPAAFEKPDTINQKVGDAIKRGINICWSFREWSDLKETEDVIFRGAVIEICKFICEKIKPDLSGKFDKTENFLNDKVKQYICDKSSEESEEFYQIFLKNFGDIQEYVTVNRGKSSQTYIDRVVKITAEIWERGKIVPKEKKKDDKDYFPDKYFGLLILTRNWTTHQGIRNMDIGFAAFIFLISVHSCFNERIFKDPKYKEYESKLFKII